MFCTATIMKITPNICFCKSGSFSGNFWQLLGGAWSDFGGTWGDSFFVAGNAILTLGMLIAETFPLLPSKSTIIINVDITYSAVTRVSHCQHLACPVWSCTCISIFVYLCICICVCMCQLVAWPASLTSQCSHLGFPPRFCPKVFTEPHNPDFPRLESR